MRIINIYISYLKTIRAIQILWVLFKHSLRELFTNRRRRRRRHEGDNDPHKRTYTTPERLRITIEELGPTFVKFGQIVADRPDMVSERFRMELKKLQSKAEPFDNDTALKLIEKELGAPIDDIFSEFDPKPLAAASIGQVYQGKLRNGAAVVIKIQRPFIENKIKLDIYLLKYIARHFAKRYPELAAINVVGLIDEFSATILKELDYTIETSNMMRFTTMFKDDPTVHFPIVYTKYCTRRIIVMEKIVGITPDTPQALREAGLDTHKIAENGTNALLKMILRHGFFHADPHPGNIFIMPNNVVAFIDCGMVGALTPRDMNFLADFAIGFAKRDSDTIARASLTLCGKKFFEREEELRFELHQLMMQYTGIPLEMLDIAGTMQKCIDVIVKYQLQIPSGIFMLIKSLATIEKFAGTLTTDLPLTKMILPYAKDVVTAKYSPRKVASQLYDTLWGYLNFIQNFPNDMSEILYKLKEGKIKHDIHLSDDDLILRAIRQASRRVAYTLIVLGMFVGAIFLIDFEHPNGTSHYGHFLLIVASILILLQLLKWFFTSDKK